MERWLREQDQVGPVTPIPGRRPHPPKVWGTITVEGDTVLARVTGWRAVGAMSRGVSVPLSAVVGVAHDPDARLHVRAKLRRRASRTGLVRLGTYHSLDGWSFWSIGLGRNAVVVEASGARFRYVVIEVADPAATVEEVRLAAGLE